MSHSLQRLKRLAPLFALIAGLLPAVEPLLAGCLPRADGVFHLYRLAQLERAISHGVLFPRWLPDVGLGYGFPLFNYYAPLSYYLALPLRYLGFAFENALLGGFLLGHLALATGAYLWAREAFGKTTALGAAFLVGYAPYPLLNLYYRGAYAEVWGVAFLAWALWALQRLRLRGGGKAFVLAALFASALMLSHNVMALLGIPLLAGYALLLAWQQRENPRLAPLPLLAIAAGLGIAAFFWLPALREQGYVQIQQLQIYDYREHFLSLGELFSGPMPVSKGEVAPDVPQSVGWILPALALVSLAPRKKTLSRNSQIQKWALAAACLMLLFMTLEISTPIWERLPLLSFIQFPSRFLAPASLGLAVLASIGLSQLAGPESWRLPALLVLVGSFSLTWLFMPCTRPQPTLTPPELIRIERETGGLGTTVAGDYLPIWVQARPGDELVPLYDAAADNDYFFPRLDADSVPEGAQILEANYGLNTAQLSLDSPSAFQARFRWYYFPGWQAKVDGEPVQVTPEGAHGLLAVAVPAGQHTLEIRFGATPLRRIANTISALSLVALVVGAWRLGTRKGRIEPQQGDISLSNHALSWPCMLALCAVGLSLFAIKTLYLNRHDSPFHPWNFDGVRMRGVDVPLQVRFGNDLVLMGYDLTGSTLTSDQPVILTLYWRVAQPTATDTSIGVHLVDAQGRLYGQEDHQHPNNYPTSLLQTDEFIRDSFTLTPFAGTPPGEHYTVLVSAYVEGTGQHTDVWDSAGQWRGTAYGLTEVTVARPNTFAAVDSLPIVQRLDADLGAGLRLLGVGDLPTSVDVGRDMLITLFWQALDTPASELVTRLELVDSNGAVVARTETPPGRADLPTPQWFEGEIIRDGQTLFIPAARFDNPTHPLESGVYTLRAGLLDAKGEAPGANVILGKIAIVAPERTFDDAGRTPLATIGDGAALIEGELAPESVRAGETLSLKLVWRAETPMSVNYSVFVHLLNESGTLIAQQDAQPGAGTRPTAGWFTGEIIGDTTTLTVPPETPSGIYTLKLGLYDPETYARLPVRGRDKQDLGDGIIWEVEVQSQE
ncbi:MAG: glycosyltransferase family 39 protein [Anaerolineae bacterium]|nr:glycosyltransferase family 39 protein [Anaerolineae bacterium]